MKLRNLLLAGLAAAAITACSNGEEFVDNGIQAPTGEQYENQFLNASRNEGIFRYARRSRRRKRGRISNHYRNYRIRLCRIQTHYQKQPDSNRNSRC